jgi:hypothetical protein
VNRTALRALAQHALDYEDSAETYVVILAYDGATYRREVRAQSPTAAVLLAKAAAGLSGVRVAVETVNPVGQLDVRQQVTSEAAFDRRLHPIEDEPAERAAIESPDDSRDALIPEAVWRQALTTALGTVCRCGKEPHSEFCPIWQYGFTGARELLRIERQRDGERVE